MKGAMLLLGISLAAILTLTAGAARDAGAAMGKPERGKVDITVLTGPPDEPYVAVGAALARIFNDRGYRCAAFATGSTDADLDGILSGRGQLAIVKADALVRAVEGSGTDSLRTMMGLWPEVVQVVAAAESGVRRFADLGGKRVAVGAPDSGEERSARAIFAAHGMSFNDAEVLRLPPDRALDLMRRGLCDAVFVTSVPGDAAIKELGATRKITFVPIEGEARDRLRRGRPCFVPARIPKDAYGTDKDVETAAVMNILIVSKNLPDAVVYDLLKGIFSRKGLKTIGASHPTARKEIHQMSALRGVGVLGSVVKLHPGAERFYREQMMRELRW